MTFQTPDTFYFVAVNFSRLGFGSGGDLMPDWDDIVDQYADSLIADEPRRVFRVEMDAGNMPASIADVTADADEAIAQRMKGAA